MTTRKNPIFSALKLILLSVIFIKLGVSDQVFASQSIVSKSARNTLSVIQQSSQKHLWGRIRKNFDINLKHTKVEGHAKIQKYVKKYAQEEKYLNKISNQASPFLFYIVEQLEKRNMPGELALLPMLESAFLPQATSNKGAAGIWQFMPATGRMHGLKQDAWYDGRRDIKASTKAALDYLEFLHKEFDENWMLALAAYNAGPGAVHKAIKRNKRAGKSTNFWELKLPKQTQEYVPKFLALAAVINDPEKHDISLPFIINQPYFKPVNAGKNLNFTQAAKLAGIDIKEVKRLNPGFRKAHTHPHGPQELLLPVVNAKKFEYNLGKSKRQ